MDGSLLLWIWFVVISPGVRLDFVIYDLASCRSPSTRPIGLSNLLSGANVNCKLTRCALPSEHRSWEQVNSKLLSSVPDSLKLVMGVCRIGVDNWIPLDCWQLDATPTVPREANLSLLCQHLCISGVPVSTTLCKFVGKAQQQLLPFTFSLKLSPLCSPLTALLPKLPICSIDEESFSQLRLYFSVSG